MVCLVVIALRVYFYDWIDGTITESHKKEVGKGRDFWTATAHAKSSRMLHKCEKASTQFLSLPLQIHVFGAID